MIRAAAKQETENPIEDGNNYQPLINMFAHKTAESLHEHCIQSGERMPFYHDPSMTKDKNLIVRLNQQKHQVITHKTGEGATHAAMFYETIVRRMNNNTVIIPIDLSSVNNAKGLTNALIMGMSRLVEVFELTPSMEMRKIQDLNILAKNFAPIVKAGGKPMQTMLNQILRANDESDSTGVENIFPTAGRQANQFVHKSEKLVLFIKKVLKLVRSAKKPQTLDQMIDQIRLTLGSEADNIQLVFDLPSNRSKSKRLLKLLTQKELLEQLETKDTSLKIFSPINPKRNPNYKIEKDLFCWNDKLIIAMLNTVIKNAGNRNTIHSFMSRDWDYVPYLLKFANKNPRKAIMLMHAVLTKALGQKRPSYTISKKEWNEICEEWTHSIPGPKKIKI